MDWCGLGCVDKSVITIKLKIILVFYIPNKDLLTTADILNFCMECIHVLDYLCRSALNRVGF